MFRPKYNSANHVPSSTERLMNPYYHSDRRLPTYKRHYRSRFNPIPEHPISRYHRLEAVLADVPYFDEPSDANFLEGLESLGPCRPNSQRSFPTPPPDDNDSDRDKDDASEEEEEEEGHVAVEGSDIEDSNDNAVHSTPTERDDSLTDVNVRIVSLIVLAWFPSAQGYTAAFQPLPPDYLTAVGQDMLIGDGTTRGSPSTSSSVNLPVAQVLHERAQRLERHPLPDVVVAATDPALPFIASLPRFSQ